MSDTPCQRCKNPALQGREHCHVHDSEFARARGSKGGTSKAERLRAARAEEAASIRAIELRTAEQMYQAIERALGRVEASGADAIDTANAVARLVTASIRVGAHVDLQTQVDELRKLIVERVPSAAAHLGEVH